MACPLSKVSEEMATKPPFSARDVRLSPRCLVSSPAAAAATAGDALSPLALSPMPSLLGAAGYSADSSFSAASSSRGHSPFGKSNHSRQSSLISSSSANSSFHAFNPTANGGRHFRQSSEPTIPGQQQQPFHSRQSSSTASGDSLGRGGEAVGGARRKCSWEKIHAFPKEAPLLPPPATNFVLGSASKTLSSPNSIDMGYHTLNGDTSSSLEPWDTSINSINLTCPAVRVGNIYLLLLPGLIN